MRGVFCILLCWLAGNALSRLTGGYVSGNIVGVEAETVRPAARFLLESMALFFVPYGVGLIDSYHVILDNLWAIVVASILSVVAVLCVTGHTFQYINRKQSKKQ